MTTFGLLSRKDIPFSNPVVSPLYPPPPTVYQDVSGIAVDYRTDLDALRAMLPELLEVADPPTVTLTVLRIPQSSLGSYNEVQVGALVRYQGALRRYFMMMYVTEATPLALGRELKGTPKKIGHVELHREASAYVGYLERPRGARLFTAVVDPIHEVDPKTVVSTTGYPLLLRVIPHPENSETTETVQLVEVPSEYEVHEQWEGPPGLGFHMQSDIDPLYRLPILELLAGRFSRMTIRSGLARVVHHWEAE